MATPGSATPRVVRFGVFELDRQALELRRNGSKVRLEGQPLTILALLVERPGQVVTREELKEKLWPGDTFVDFEHSINVAVKRLRETLQDSATAPRFIETLPRRGYRFIYPLTAESDEAVAESTPQPRQRTIWIAAGAVMIAALLLAALLRSGGTANPPAGRTQVVNSIAVLPFKNLTGNPQEDFLADGATDVFTTELAQSKQLVIPSLTSAMYYKNERKRLPEIARELKVQAFVEGGVQRLGNDVVLSVQLVEGETDRHLWANSYRCPTKDLPQVIHNAARHVLHELNVRAEAELASQNANPLAVEAYLKARFHLRRGTREDRDKAYEFLLKAIELDPLYAAPHAQMAILLTNGRPRVGEFAHPKGENALFGHMQHAGLRQARAREYAMRALELDNFSSDAHTALGWINLSVWDWAAAESSFRRAIELNPNNTLAHLWFGQYLSAMGRSAEALEEANTALRLEPASPDIVTHAAFPYMEAGRIDQAMALWKNVIDLEPNYAWAWQTLARAELCRGMYRQAIEHAQTTLRLVNDDDPFTLGVLAYGYAKAGERKKAAEIIAALENRAKNQRMRAGALALAYLGLDNRDKALTWVEKAYEQHGDLLWINSDPLYAPLRSEPRYQAAMSHLSLPAFGQQRSAPARQ